MITFPLLLLKFLSWNLASAVWFFFPFLLKETVDSAVIETLPCFQETSSVQGM